VTDYAALLSSAQEMDDVSRRSFLKLLGASMALAGVDGCTRMPAEKILPYVNQPPEVTPGIPLHFATAMTLDGFATGLIVESHEGRPTKIEGNPLHPASLGASTALQQASLLQLYDPDRGRRVLHKGTSASWDAWLAEFGPGSARARVGARGAGFHLLLEPTGSPTIAALVEKLRSLYPDMGVHFYSPMLGIAGAAAAELPQYDLSAADVIVCFDADVLASGPFSLRYARQFADGRRQPARGMNRLYVAESAYTCTGMAADDRVRCRPGVVQGLLEQLHNAVSSGAGAASTGFGDGADAWLANVAADVREHRGRVLVIAGDRLGPQAQVLAAAINSATGAAGTSVWYAASPLLGAGDREASLATLLQALHARSVDTLVCIGGNPAYRSPGSLQLADAMRSVPHSAYVGMYADETAQACNWYVPLAHYLESWGDARAYDGSLSVVQPLVQPLFGAKQQIEVLGALAGGSSDPFTTVRDTWNKAGHATSDDAWNDVVRAGVLAESAYQRNSAAQRIAAAGSRFEGLRPLENPPGGLDVIFTPDARVHDGRFSNNPWLQELPDPITKQTWGNAALVSPTTATRLGVETGDMVTIERGGGTLRLPAIVSPGHADGVVSVSFGYGRAGAESVARGIGANAYAIWPALDAFVATDATVRAAGAHRELAITQTHWSMEAREPARTMSVAEYKRKGSAAPEPRRQLSLYPPDHPNGQAPQQWAMTIDLGTCIGCSACVVACQAENNIPVVGPDDVRKSREMHWLRIDRYMAGDANDPDLSLQPMLCQQCEKAPCEYVCPVGATTHSADGLNEMVYNRCVGTRFCSNNCPYKVRRFNWFDYNAELAETERMARNPDVTVRERGVMEKCTFCVQRIRQAEIGAQLEGRDLKGSEVVTACAQACPTRAIVFGSLTEPDSEMMKRRQEPRAYEVLEELGTAPRIQYLARIRNAREGAEPRA
jgi:molybdopterin-containing oxidoreductase family iron-sulfur binding subunit